MKKLLLLLALVIGCGRQDPPVTGTVLRKQHVPSSSSIGPVFGGQGGTTVVFHPEQWTVVVKADSGGEYHVNTSKAKWEKVKDGQRWPQYP